MAGASSSFVYNIFEKCNCKQFLENINTNKRLCPPKMCLLLRYNYTTRGWTYTILTRFFFLENKLTELQICPSFLKVFNFQVIFERRRFEIKFLV